MPEFSSSTYSATDASNTSASPNGAPENMPPSGVNDSMRALMGATKRFWQRIQGAGFGAGSANTYTITYSPALAALVDGERYSFRVAADNTGAATLNINGLGATAIKKMTSSGKADLASGDLKSGQPATVEYDGTHFVLVSPIANLVTYATAAQGKTATSAAVALTPAAAAAGGEGPWADLASATTTDLGAQNVTNLRITGTTTITGFGTIDSGVRRQLRFADALTLTHNGTSLILPGGANITTAANDSCVAISLGSGNWFVVGYQRAAGSSKVVQEVVASIASRVTCSTTVPLDDTIPQNTEGTEVVTVSVTPIRSDSTLEIEAVIFGYATPASSIAIGALFKDSTADAIAAATLAGASGDVSYFSGTLLHRQSSGSTSAQTFKLRVGGSTGTVYVNGNNTARLFGGVGATYIKVREVLA